ncbi:MAG: hypothetical protein ACOC22_02560 [bacterium]
MLNVKNILKTIDNPEKNPVEFYEELISYLLEVGVPYSSFVEILFANMFVCDEESTKFWRYNQSLPIIRKVNDKRLAMIISPSLGCLYQPNKASLNQIDNIEKLEDDQPLTIYEKIWSCI